MAFEAGDKDNDQAKVAEKGRHSFSFGEKKRVPHSPKPVDELRQASGSNWVADVGSQSSTRNQRTGEKVVMNSACFPDYSAGGSTTGAQWY